MNEFKHADKGNQLTKTEWEESGTHEADGQLDKDVLYYDSASGYWKRSPLHERTVTADWDIGDYKLTAKQLAADIADGTAPLVITSTTLVSNLNADKLDGYEATAFVLKSLFDANTILAANTDDTPAAVTVAENRIVGRITAGNIAALTAAQVMAMLSGGATAAFSMNSQKITSLGQPTTAGDAIRQTATITEAALGSTIAASHTQDTDTDLGALGTKNPPIDADKAIYRDSTNSDALVTSTWAQIKAFLKTYFDGLYSGGGFSVDGGAANRSEDDGAEIILDLGHAIERKFREFKQMDFSSGFTSTLSGTGYDWSSNVKGQIGTGATSTSESIKIGGYQYHDADNSAYWSEFIAKVKIESDSDKMEVWIGYFAANNVLPTATSNHYGFKIISDTNGVSADISATNGDSATEKATEVVSGITSYQWYYLRAVYMGTQIVYYTSTDGENWTLVASHTVNIPDDCTLYFGVAIKNTEAVDKRLVVLLETAV